MRRRLSLLLTSVVLGGCFWTAPPDATSSSTPAAGSVAPAEAAAPGVGTTAPRRPTIVFVLADDLDLEAMSHLPRLKAMLTDQGTTFANAFVDVPQCCPSRASILRGQYAHNTEVYTNKYPNGGYRRFRESGLEQSTVGTWLRAAGYHTAYLGKYLNGYGTLAVPPGWDEWYAVPDRAYFEYDLNENGTRVRYGSAPSDYSTDVIAEKAVDVIRRHSAGAAAPLFLFIAPIAPHIPATPAPRHATAFSDRQVPRSPAYDEIDVADKPEWIRRLPEIGEKERDREVELYPDRLRSMLAVEEMIAALLDALRNAGQLDSTYLFFSSDNGLHLGQHRLRVGKLTVYEEDVHVPLIVRGPGVATGAVREELVLNTDLGPTWAELAGIAPPAFVDGRSFAPLILGADPMPWRSAVLIEVIRPARPEGQPAVDTEEEEGNPPTPPFSAIRTARYKYVEYEGGERELYDLVADPYELDNLSGTADAALVEALADRLAALRSCSGPACRSAEDR